MNRYLFRAMLAITSAINTVAPLYAAAPASFVPLDGWVQQANKSLDQAMVDPAGDAAGLVRIDFRLNPDGVPTDVVIRTDDAALRRAAQLTLARVGSLPPLPAGYPSSQRIGVRLLFSNDDEGTYLRQRKALLASAAQVNQQVAAAQTETRVAIARPQ